MRGHRQLTTLCLDASTTAPNCLSTVVGDSCHLMLFRSSSISSVSYLYSNINVSIGRLRFFLFLDTHSKYLFFLIKYISESLSFYMRNMYTNYKPFDRDGRKKNLREGLPAYAYSRGVELHSEKYHYPNVSTEMYDPRKNVLNINHPVNEPVNVPEFELPNEEQISYYEQLMMMNNKTIVLSNFLKNQSTNQICPTAIYKNPEFVHGITLKNNAPSKKGTTEPFYKICFELMNAPIKDTKWKLCLITENSTEIRSEIQQIYLHMWLYYKNYMEKVDLGVLDTCNKIMGFEQSVTETERFYLSMRDDYLMASQTLILFKNILSDQHISLFEQMMDTLELWKSLLQKMSSNPKMYELSLYNISMEMTELLELLAKSYFKIRHYLEACFILMIDKEDTIKEQQVKDDMLCKYWYSMVDTPEHI